MKLRLLALFWLGSVWAQACALCQGYDAVIFPRLSVEANATHLQTLTVEWPFTQSLTAQVIANFDTNQNGSLEPGEKATLVKSWEDELDKTGYYTHLHLNGSPHPVNRPIDRLFSIENGHGLYRFTITLNRPIEPESKIGIRFFEPLKTLSFFFDRQSFSQTSAGPWRLEHNLASFPRTFELVFKGAAPASAPKRPTPIAQTQPPQENLAGWLKQAFDRLRNTLETLKENPSASLFWSLLGFSFLYGLLHAAGPGHGKTLVASYFFATGGNHKKAGAMALLIGTVHVFSALILTALLIFALNVVFATALEDAQVWLARLSGVLILFIAAHLLIRRVRAARAAPKSRFSTQPPCGCAACSTGGRAEDLGVVIAAGIIPCPGTVTIFLFALSMGLYWTGLAAAVAMSLGMGAVIFASAVLGGALKKSGNGPLKRLGAFLEWGSIGIIAILGILLLLG